MPHSTMRQFIPFQNVRISPAFQRTLLLRLRKLVGLALDEIEATGPDSPRASLRESNLEPTLSRQRSVPVVEKRIR